MVDRRSFLECNASSRDNTSRHKMNFFSPFLGKLRYLMARARHSHTQPVVTYLLMKKIGVRLKSHVLVEILCTNAVLRDLH
jgi:hypothetical protein